ncbi:DUF4148 domain-containing protein [Paraburkholderia sp. SARCC-3016]|uniref:DUF4148 domain-containing protein n=1 Tax=Paraburkholderia sp. SARCC-3016 TaxID=3058611 RepID=UPI00280897B6|nr:DUF4148 domain-containing protein [Paraburkholderia sp. SARCC-3016]MDQ7981290.1 DUF4148 domain-containing protein [Paraburkholderia sp. SARCC-3016]
MKAAFLHAVPLALMLASSFAFASQHLTRKECDSYPFKPAHGAPSRADVSRELRELESFGYRPALDNYSPDIGDARNRLNAEYAKDCAPAANTAARNAATSG